MKKVLSIALVALFVAASVFAGWKSGNATIEFGYNLDTADYGFENGTAVKYNFGFELGSDKAAKAGEGDLKAEIVASFSAEIAAKNYTGAATMASPSVALSISKANVIYKDKVVVSILGAGTSTTYAKAYYKDSGKDVDNIKGLSGVPGFNLTVDGYKAGFGLTGNTEADTFKVLAYASTKEYEVAEGLKAQAAAAVLADQDAATIIAAAKASYAKDKFSASAAADLKSADEKVALEAAATAKYDFVTANAYFYTADSFENNQLDAKVVGEKTIEAVTVNASVEVTNALAEKRELIPGATVTAKVEDFTIVEKVSAKVLAAKTVESVTTVTYSADFTAACGITVEAGYGEDGKVTKIAPTASVESDALIDGATVSLEWAGADFAEGNEKKGAVTAAITIAL